MGCQQVQVKTRLQHKKDEKRKRIYISSQPTRVVQMRQACTDVPGLYRCARVVSTLIRNSSTRCNTRRVSRRSVLHLLVVDNARWGKEMNSLRFAAIITGAF